MNQAPPNHDARENLSAGIDGELPVEQLRFLLRRLDHDEAMRQAWSGYHFARDGLRREISMRASSEFADRVMRAIEQEGEAAAPRRSHAWLRWSGGGVIAASVAAAALMLGQPASDAGRLNPAAGAGSELAVSAPPAARVAPPSVPPWLSGNAASLLSQQASATLGAPLQASQSRNARRLSTYPAMHRYRTLDNNDGSYLLLLDPAQPGTPGATRQAGTGLR